MKIFYVMKHGPDAMDVVAGFSEKSKATEWIAKVEKAFPKTHYEYEIEQMEIDNPPPVKDMKPMW